MMLTDSSLDRKMSPEPNRNSKTRITVTLMAMNVLMDMIVHIVLGQRRDTRKKQQRRIRLEDVCYANDYGNHTVSDAPDGCGVGQEKRVAKQVSFKKY